MSANDPKRTFGRGSRCALEQPQESANHRDRQDENGLQDTHHHDVVVVHPICRGLPHFALPLLLESTNQPPQGEAGWYISQPNDCHDKGLGWGRARG
jgi:hypothetical protein